MVGKRALVHGLLALGVAIFVLRLVPYDQELATRLVAAALTREALTELPLPEPPPREVPKDQLPKVRLEVEATHVLAKTIQQSVVAARGFRVVQNGASVVIKIRMREHLSGLEIHASHVMPPDPEKIWQHSRRLPTPWSALPPLVAIIFALATRRVVLAIFTGTLVGSFIFLVGSGSPDPGVLSGLSFYLLAGAWAIFKALAQYVLGAATSTFTLYVLGFTFALCGMVAVANRAGGNKGIVLAIAGVATNARRMRLATGLMGLAIFFEDYANAIVVGRTARPLTDAMRISREKLAYLVDSTSAPVASIALVSTWIGWEVGLFQSVADAVGIATRGYQIFLQAVPFRFYCFFTLIFLFASTLLRRDYGPMLTAERRAFHEGLLVRPGAKPLTSGTGEKLKPAPGVVPRWWITGIPILVLLLAVLVGMIVNGANHRSLRSLPFELSWIYLRDCFAHGDNGPVLLFAALLGTVCVVFLARTRRAPVKVTTEQFARTKQKPILSYKDISLTWLVGGWASVYALVILVTAKALQNVCDDLSTSAYLVALVGENLPFWLLPICVFLLSSGVAFATGTSWGTMGILIPAVGPLAYHLGGMDLMVLVLASVLDGAIFGDHCSPISDTTIMSSLSSECDHVDHVRTQGPYALTCMLIAGVVGYLGVSFGFSSWFSLLFGTVLIVAILLLVGKDPEREAL
ncbi:MAG: Na+/H+ antiporter NhaC family protein [Pseudomonadota bacterium]